MLRKKILLAVACLAIAHTAFPAEETPAQRYQREVNQAIAESIAMSQQPRQAPARETAQQRYDRELKQAMQESQTMAQPARPVPARETAQQRYDRELKQAMQESSAMAPAPQAVQLSPEEEEYQQVMKLPLKRIFDRDTQLLQKNQHAPGFNKLYGDKILRWKTILKANAPDYPQFTKDVNDWVQTWHKKFGLPKQ